MTTAPNTIRNDINCLIEVVGEQVSRGVGSRGVLELLSAGVWKSQTKNYNRDL